MRRYDSAFFDFPCTLWYIHILYYVPFIHLILVEELTLNVGSICRHIIFSKTKNLKAKNIFPGKGSNFSAPLTYHDQPLWTAIFTDAQDKSFGRECISTFDTDKQMSSWAYYAVALSPSSSCSCLIILTWDGLQIASDPLRSGSGSCSALWSIFLNSAIAKIKMIFKLNCYR